jgi:hypothetical protein
MTAVGESLPAKELLRIDEVATHFDVSERTIRLWADHGLLTAEKYTNSTIRVTRASVVEFRLKSRFISEPDGTIG